MKQQMTLIKLGKLGILLKKGKNLISGTANGFLSVAFIPIQASISDSETQIVDETLRKYGGIGTSMMSKMLPNVPEYYEAPETLNRAIEETKGEMKLLESEFISECTRKN